MMLPTYEDILKSLVERDERFMVITAENRAPIRNLPALIGNRFIDTGITEQTMIGMCAGLALRGRIPVAHALASFLTMRAFEFIRTDIGIPALPVKVVGYVPGFLSDGNGPTHQAIEDIALMRGIPGMNIFCPADGHDMAVALETILLHPSPFYIRYNNRKPVYAHDDAFSIGRAELVMDGSDVTILTYGFLFSEAYQAAQLLKASDISVRLVNLRTLKPVDEELIVRCAKETRLVVTLEDHLTTGGLYSIVAEILLRQRTPAHVMPLSLKSWFRPGRLNEVLEYEGFTPQQIAENIQKKLNSTKVTER